MKRLFLASLTVLLAPLLCLQAAGRGAEAEKWPDGQPVSAWFGAREPVDPDGLGRRYCLTDNGIYPDGRLHTEEIQSLIDRIAAEGGGVLEVPAGTFLTGGLHFRPGTNLYLEEGAVLMGSDFIGDYPLGVTRIEGQTCTYFGALINAEGVDGFTICGSGTIDGNGERYHRQFWLRRKWNPQCANKDEQRPRLVYVSDSRNVRIDGVCLQNSPYWTTHFHNCENLCITGCRFLSSWRSGEVKAPSTDAIDLDVVRNVLVRDCYFSVNDDAVVLKGGKGPYADAFMKEYPGVVIPSVSAGNGGNENVLIEDCEYCFCHGCLTLGSESVLNHNIVLRRARIRERAINLLWLKCRPDTPQRYEYVTVEDVEGSVRNFLNVNKWTQFYDLQGRQDSPVSYVEHIVMRRCKVDCDVFFNASRQDDVYSLSDFRFEDLDIKAGDESFDHGFIKGCSVKDVCFR